MKTITLKMCKIRPDLVNEGISIPVGKTHIESGEYPYRLLSNDKFQILLNGRWTCANSIDFTFYPY